VLSGVAPYELARLLGEEAQRPEGAQVKVNLLLSRLPKLREASADPVAAFAGTFHVHEGFTAIDTAYNAAREGRIPSPLPLESYCHSLTDPSILSPELQASGAQTLTVFGLQTPDRLLEGRDADAARAELQAAVLRSLDSVLAEPLEGVLLTDTEGRPCIETATTRDLERSLRMPGGNIFHGPLDWPWADDDAPLSTPAERWGVATAHDRILECGSGSGSEAVVFSATTGGTSSALAAGVAAGAHPVSRRAAMARGMTTRASLVMVVRSGQVRPRDCVNRPKLRSCRGGCRGADSRSA
jgi:phytoene dehydrogenase-like protein